jgi:DNA-binding response OmpR family regulator
VEHGNQEASAQETAWKQYSVLVVDDEPGMVSFLQRALGSRCGSVDTAGSVEAAAILLRRRLYDLIVLDITCPAAPDRLAARITR